MPRTRGQRSALRARDSLDEVAVDIVGGLFLTAAAEFAIDHSQRQIEELHRDATFADVDADGVGAVCTRSEQRDRAAAARGDRADLGDQSVLDEFGSDVGGRRGRQPAAVGECGAGRLAFLQDELQGGGTILLTQRRHCRRLAGRRRSRPGRCAHSPTISRHVRTTTLRIRTSAVVESVRDPRSHRPLTA